MIRYNSYKDSGIEWIGEIPNEWISHKLKFINEISKESISTDEMKNKSVIHYSIPNIQKYGTGKLEEGNDIDSSKLLLLGNEVLISKLNPRKSTVCMVETHTEMIVGSGEFLSFIPHSLNRKYLYYSFINPKFTEYLDSSVESVTRSHQRVKPDLVYDSLLFLPSNNEQQQIVSYLDAKTSLIDSLIEKTQKKIELLKEKRTSLINHTVTKGLNPNVKMKDSGVEWIGEIPKEWNLSKLKFITNQIVDGTHFTPKYTDSGVPFLRVTDIHNKEIDLDKVKFISEIEHLELIKRCNPQKGDLLLSKNGTIGLTKVIDWIWEFSVFVSLCLIKFKSTYSPFLFSYLFQSDVVEQQISESSKKSTVTNLHLDKIRELKIVVPPIEEQNKILEYLDEKTEIIDATITQEQKRTKLLKEYRQSLISEVVTGKIKVTNE
jgi:type I restriction enzyme, S subunit